MGEVINRRQKEFLALFSNSKLSKSFYFSGGTALSYFYLNHRFSEDLDFFSEREFDIQQIAVFLKSIKNKLKYKAVDYQESFNRNIYQLHFDKDFLKIEFTYFPFKQIEKPKEKQGILVDSLIDIGTNKIFTVNQNARGRDYFDLYFIAKKEKISLEKLRKLAKVKFDWHVDPLNLGSKLMRVTEFIDDPILIKKVDKSNIIGYFQKEASRLGKEILKK